MYPPLVEYGLKVVRTTTTLITTNIAAVAPHLDLAKATSNAKGLVATFTVYGYAFLSIPTHLLTYFSDGLGRVFAIASSPPPTLIHHPAPHFLGGSKFLGGGSSLGDVYSGG